MNLFSSTMLVGVGATAMMDAWTIARRILFGTPLPNYAHLGRWIGHMGRGRLRHAAIAAAAPLRHERLLGWTAHYLVGIAFAALLAACGGIDWFQQPTIGPALIVGIATVGAPFLLMQPAMGAGIAARNTPRPNAARLHSLATHAIFGLGLYASGLAARLLG